MPLLFHVFPLIINLSATFSSGTFVRMRGLVEVQKSRRYEIIFSGPVKPHLYASKKLG